MNYRGSLADPDMTFHFDSDPDLDSDQDPTPGPAWPKIEKMQLKL